MQPRISHTSAARLDADEIHRQAADMRAAYIKASVRNLISDLRGHAGGAVWPSAAGRA